ncbi:hypothetical protein SCLCIDRAFT_1215112 [Scleroderma citrinum Foug A]|uniref:Uncharacterized protein n=1 Tax=Scleroderma citrinum Foug A TaxID=1036808 RepID=A0A0C2ZLR1_9AGAM|nr:hypothetical protein SCLCIDRAFT_1215112 [Scleroderma citrinum Foug A]
MISRSKGTLVYYLYKNNNYLVRGWDIGIDSGCAFSRVRRYYANLQALETMAISTLQH